MGRRDPSIMIADTATGTIADVGMAVDIGVITNTTMTMTIEP